jgi:hypothetical protein
VHGLAHTRGAGDDHIRRGSHPLRQD